MDWISSAYPYTNSSSVNPDVDLVVLDWDGVLYKYPPEFLDSCYTIAAKTACSLLGENRLSLADAHKLAKASSKEHGWTFVGFRERFGLQIKDWHHRYHEGFNLDLIPKLDVTAEQIKACRHPLAIFTNSTRSLIHRSMKKFGLKGAIPDDLIIALEDVEYLTKRDDVQCYDLFLKIVSSALGREIRPEKTLFVEDSPPNLLMAKKAGWITVLVTQGKTVEPKKHPYVDFVFENLPHFMDALNEGFISSPYLAPLLAPDSQPTVPRTSFHGHRSGYYAPLGQPSALTPD